MLGKFARHSNLKSMKKSLFLIKSLSLVAMLSLVLVGCKQEPKNTDCTYDTITTMAEIKEIKPHADGQGRIAVVLDFKASKLALEDQELGDLKEISIDHDFLVRNNLSLGNKYEVVVSEIVSGDCTPLFVSFNHDLN